MIALAACSGAGDRASWSDAADVSGLATPSESSFVPPAAEEEVDALSMLEGARETGSSDPRGGDKEILPVSGRLVGVMGGFEFDHEGTSNLGESIDWPQGGSLVLRVTVQAESGAGMIMLTIEGGPDHPLLTDGRWTSEQAEQSESLDPEGPRTWVRSCAGPDLADCAFQEPPLRYELVAEPDASNPDGVSIRADLSLAREENVTATMSFVPPAP